MTVDAMTVGARVQRARGERKLSLADVSRETKIQPWVLEALEADRLQELMSPIYVKGFLTTYAKFFHLDPAPLLLELPWPALAEPVQAALPTAPPVSFSWSFPTLDLPWPLIRRVGLAAVGLAVLVGIASLHPLQRLSKGRLALQTAPKLASISTVRSETPPPELPTLTLLATQPLELSVTANHTTWIQVRADGKLLTQQRLSRGAQERWTAKKQLELVVSQPSQVDILLNGQPISSFAIAHRGRLLITHHGITKLPAEEP